MSLRSTKSSQGHSECSIKSGHSNLLYDSNRGDVYCYYGLKAPLATSTSDENPGRRFFGCSNYKVNGCNFFAWHDQPLDNEHIKALLIEFRNRNKLLQQEISKLKNKNRCLSKMVAKVKVENECLRKISYDDIHDELYDEIAALKAENEVAAVKFKLSQIESRRETKVKLMYKYSLIIIVVVILYNLVYGTEIRMKKSVLALP